MLISFSDPSRAENRDSFLANLVHNLNQLMPDLLHADQ